jgi:hypothetical protein
MFRFPDLRSDLGNTRLNKNPRIHSINGFNSQSYVDEYGDFEYTDKEIMKKIQNECIGLSTKSTQKMYAFGFYPDDSIIGHNYKQEQTKDKESVYALKDIPSHR